MGLSRGSGICAALDDYMWEIGSRSYTFVGTRPFAPVSTQLYTCSGLTARGMSTTRCARRWVWMLKACTTTQQGFLSRWTEPTGARGSGAAGTAGCARDLLDFTIARLKPKPVGGLNAASEKGELNHERARSTARRRRFVRRVRWIGCTDVKLQLVASLKTAGGRPT